MSAAGEAALGLQTRLLLFATWTCLMHFVPETLPSPPCPCRSLGEAAGTLVLCRAVETGAQIAADTPLACNTEAGLSSQLS